MNLLQKKDSLGKSRQILYGLSKIAIARRSEDSTTIRLGAAQRGWAVLNNRPAFYFMPAD